MQNRVPSARLKASLATAVTVSLAISGATAAQATELVDRASGVADLVSEASSVGSPDPSIDVIDPTTSGDELVAAGQSATVVVPVSLDRPLEVEPEGRWSGALTGVTIDLPSSVEEGHVDVAADGSIVSGPAEVQAVIQPSDEGLRISTVLASEEAPTTYEYKLPADVDVVLNTDGSASLSRTVSGEDGASITANIGQIAKPWAVDASGGEVTTWYEAAGSSIIQHVEHESASTAYPVVADPKFWWGWNVYVSNTTIGKITTLLLGGAAASQVARALINFIPGIGALAGNVTQLAAALMAFKAAAINVCNIKRKGVFIGWTWVPGTLPFVPTIFRNGYFCLPA